VKFEDVRERIYSIPGLLMVGQEEWLFEMAKSLPDEAVILEIGGYLGRSTCCLAFGCVGTRKRVFTVDTFDANLDSEIDESHTGVRKFYGVWKRNVEKNGLLEYVIPMVGFSRDIAKSWERMIDFLFIDGSHKYEDVLADFDSFYPYVRAGGLVAFHDVEGGHPDVVRVWHEKAEKVLTEIGRCASIAFGRKDEELRR